MAILKRQTQRVYQLCWCILSLLGCNAANAANAANAEVLFEGASDNFVAPTWVFDLELANRALFRSQIIDDDQVAFRFGVTRFLPNNWSLSGQMHSARGSGAVGWESQVALAKAIIFLGVGITGHGEYVRWHNSNYEPMALIGVTLRKEAIRLLVKQDVNDGGGQHLEFNLRLFRRNKTTLAIAVVDSVLPQTYGVSFITAENPDDPDTPIESMVISKSAQEVQYVAVQASYLALGQTRLFGQFFHSLGNEVGRSNWLAGMRWYWPI